MTYQATDLSTDAGAPVELYEFTVPGSTLAWKYTNAPSAEGDYSPEAISHGDISQSAGNVGATTSIEVGDQNAVAVAMLAGLSSRPVQVVIREKHRGDTDDEEQQVFVGLVTGVSFSGAKATLACGSRYALVSKRRVPWLTFQAGCNWEWGGVGCGVNRNTYRVTLSLTAANQTERTLTATVAASQADGYYSGGWVERASTGETRFIEEHTGDQLLLALPWAELSGTAEDYYLFPGCQKTEAYCASAFGNLNNYLGWPRLPSINPFNRSAYYQTGVPDIPDPGDTWELGGGYSTVLTDQTITIDHSGYEFSPLTYWRYRLTFEPTGYLRIQVGGTVGMPVLGPGAVNTVATGGVWINPKGSDASIAGLLDVWAGVPVSDSSGALPNTSGNFASWVDGGATPSLYSDWGIPTTPEGRVTTTILLRVRDKATGVVRAEATLTLVHLVSIGALEVGGL